MATQLLDSAQRVFTPEIIQKIGALIGESAADTQKAVDIAIPSVFAGMLNYVSSSPEGLDRLIHLLDRGNSGQLLDDTTTLLSGGDASQRLLHSGQEILETIFGNRVNTLTDLIANSSGLKSTSASSLLSITAPLLLAVLGRERTTQRLNPAGLANLLLSNTEWIARLAPPGLAGILGLPNMASLGSGLAGAATPTVTRIASPVQYEATIDEDEVSSLGTWLIPLLIAGLLLPWFIFTRGCSGGPAPVANHATAPAYHATPAAQSKVAAPSTPAVTAVGLAPEPTAQDEAASTAEHASPGQHTAVLPSGHKLSLDDTSLNYQVTRFLADTGDTEVLRTFIFEQPTFVLGTAQMTPDLEQTVKDLAAILKAYPTAEGQVGSHTDFIGDPATNKRLSQARADAVKEYLTKNGIDESRLSAEGYGQEKPRASNETAEGRAENRRLELVVVKK